MKQLVYMEFEQLKHHLNVRLRGEVETGSRLSVPRALMCSAGAQRLVHWNHWQPERGESESSVMMNWRVPCVLGV